MKISSIASACGVLGVAWICGMPAIAEGGRTSSAWLYDTEVIPERGVEIESWILDENNKGKDDAPKVDETLVWWAPVVGITDRVELAVPVELDHTQVSAPGGAGDTRLARFGAEVRWRLASPDPLEAGKVVALVRLGAKRMIEERRRGRGEADIVVSADLGGTVHAVVDLGGVAQVGEGDDDLEARPGAGVSVLVAPDLRVGAETYAQLNLAEDGARWMIAGPNLAWTHGRFWLSASFGIGLFGISTAPRINWAVAF